MSPLIDLIVGPVITGQILVYIGAGYTPKPIKWWNGSAWVVKPLKSWNGSAWIATHF